jgi:hypothetical protein
MKWVPPTAPTSTTYKGVTVHQVISRTFTQEKKEPGSFRLLQDPKASGLNPNLISEPFRMNGEDTVRNMANEGDHTVALDLTSAYFQALVVPPLRMMLRTKIWVAESVRGGPNQWVQKMAEYQTLSQGIRPAPVKFTKLVRAVLKVLTECGMWHAIGSQDRRHPSAGKTVRTSDETNIFDR